MKLTLGYLKDLLAFASIVLFIFFITISNIKLKPNLIKFLFFGLITLIFIFDGLFTVIPTLHNYVIIY
jgi:hypothetical protein